MLQHLQAIHLSDQLLTPKQFQTLTMLRRRKWARDRNTTPAHHEFSKHTSKFVKQMQAIENRKRDRQSNSNDAAAGLNSINGNDDFHFNDGDGDDTIGGGNGLGGDDSFKGDDTLGGGSNPTNLKHDEDLKPNEENAKYMDSLPHTPIDAMRRQIGKPGDKYYGREKENMHRMSNVELTARACKALEGQNYDLTDMLNHELRARL